MRGHAYSRRDLLRRGGTLAAMGGSAALLGESPFARFAAAQDATPAPIELPPITDVRTRRTFNA